MTHYEGTEDEVLGLDTYIKLMRAADTVTAFIDEALAGPGLTHSQLGVLEALLHLGPLCQGDLSAKLLKSSGNLTMVVTNLERRGFVQRSRGKKDRRFVNVTLTDRGRTVIEEYFPKHARRVRSAMASLDAQEQATLAALCRKLGRAARED